MLVSFQKKRVCSGCHDVIRVVERKIKKTCVFSAVCIITPVILYMIYCCSSCLPVRITAGTLNDKMYFIICFVCHLSMRR